jgi:transposase
MPYPTHNDGRRRSKAVDDRIAAEAATAPAALRLLVSTQTIRRWLSEGLLPAEQTAEHAPWRIRITDEVRQRFVPTVPDGYVKLDDAARQLGLSRQTILNQVRAGRRNAVHVVEGKRRGLRIEIRPGEQGLLELTSRRDV